MKVAAVLAAIRLMQRIKAFWSTYCEAKRKAQDAAVRANGGGGV